MDPAAIMEFLKSNPQMAQALASALGGPKKAQTPGPLGAVADQPNGLIQGMADTYVSPDMQKVLGDERAQATARSKQPVGAGVGPYNAYVAPHWTQNLNAAGAQGREGMVQNQMMADVLRKRDTAAGAATFMRDRAAADPAQDPIAFNQGGALVGAQAGGPLVSAGMMEKQSQDMEKVQNEALKRENTRFLLEKTLGSRKELAQPFSGAYTPEKGGFTLNKTTGAMNKLAQDPAAVAAKASMKPGDQPMNTGTLEMLAHQYARTGQLPPLGMGQAAVAHRLAIFNKAAELYPGLDVAGQMAGFGADKTSLTGVTKMSDAVEAFERTAGLNLNLLLETASKIPDTGSPWLNKPIRTVDEKALGSTEMAAYRAARQVALTEISRVVSNPNLVGQLSDQARKEVFEFNPDNATFAQTVAVAKILRRDMNNRIASLREQRAIIKGRISTTPGQQETTPGSQPSSPKRIKIDANGNVIP